MKWQKIIRAGPQKNMSTQIREMVLQTIDIRNKANSFK